LWITQQSEFFVHAMGPVVRVAQVVALPRHAAPELLELELVEREPLDDAVLEDVRVPAAPPPPPVGAEPQAEASRRAAKSRCIPSVFIGSSSALSAAQLAGPHCAEQFACLKAQREVVGAPRAERVRSRRMLLALERSTLTAPGRQ
jgi:hypothetical protein